MVDTTHAEYLKKLDHDYSMRGDIEDIGRIKTTSHQSQNSNKVIEEKRKKHDRALQQLLNHQEALRRFDEILTQLKDRIHELEQLQLQSSQAWELITNNDTDGSIDFLIEYHGVQRDDLEAMSADEILAIMLNLEGQNQDSIENLKSDIKNLVQEAHLITGEHFDANNPKHQAVMNRLEAMETRAENLNTDFDQVLENVHFETGNTYTLLEARIDAKPKESLFQKSENITDKFNAQSLGDNDLNKQHNQELQASNTIIQKPIGMNL